MQKLVGILVVCGGILGACKKEVPPTPPSFPMLWRP